MTQQLLLTLIAMALVVLIAGMPASADFGWSGSEGPTPPGGFVSIESQPDPAHLPPGWDTPCYGECPPLIMTFSPGDTFEFKGQNTASGTTYLFIIGPGLDENGAQIQNKDPATLPVESGDPATFAKSPVRSDHTWSWTWDMTGSLLKDGTYQVIASSHPNGLDTGQAVTARGYYTIKFKNPSGTTGATTTSTTSATPALLATTKPVVTETAMPGEVTIMVRGSQDCILGDEINFSGTNTAPGWKTYLFITGPGLAENGSQIQSTDLGNAPVVNDNPITFKQMDVQGDHTWSWRWGTANTKLDPGTYTVWAVGGPKDAGHLEKTPHGTVSITLKKAAGSTAAPVSPAPTTLVPPVAATTTAPSPGFGIAAALAGLGAVALFMSRRH